MRMMTRIAWLAFTVGCVKSREPAPSEMEDLTRYMFKEWEDESALQAALDNLRPWLSANIDSEDSLQGYRLGALLDGDVETVERPDRSLTNLLGAAVAGVSSHSMDAHAWSILEDDQVFANPATYDHYRRTVEGDDDRFRARTGLIRTVNEVQTTTLGVTIPYTLHKDYRWLAGDEEPDVIVARSWIPEKGCNPGGDNCLELSFSIDVFLDHGAATHRFTATWSEVSSPFAAFLSDEQLIASLSNGMADVYTDVDAHLDEAYP